MGKDKAKESVKIPFKTKESLKKDNRKLSRELRELQRRFKEVTNVVHHLELDYESSKDCPPPMRYGMLKEMIKRATTDEILEKSRPPSPKDVKAAAKRADDSDSEGTPTQSSGPLRKISQPDRNMQMTSRGSLAGTTGGLLASCKGFAGVADSSAGVQENKIASRDVRLSKKEVASDNDQKVKDINGYESKFLRAHNRLVRLRQEYEDSKHMVFIRRYNAMKDMIKKVIRDKQLSAS